jgi:predicted transcriptional regulator
MTAKNRQENIPLPRLNQEWFAQRFPEMDRIQVLDGLGEQWKKQKLNSTIVVAFHADLEVAQLKHFFPFFFTEYLIRNGYSISPVVYIGALRDIGRGYHRGDIRERIAEAHKFFQGIFSPTTQVVIVEDRIEIQRDVYSILRILEFEKTLQDILRQIDTPEKLAQKNIIQLKDKTYHISEFEKELLGIYLFERNKLGTEIKKYPYVSWGIESLGHLGTSYYIFDKSNAGLSVLKKMICEDQDIEYPGTIVLPDPIAISGRLMRYMHSRELNQDETLFIIDSYSDVSRKIYERTNVSHDFLGYLMRNIILPFAKTSRNKDVEACWEKFSEHKHSIDQTASRDLKRIVLKCYWEFIKHYYESMETILGTHESLFVPEELIEKTLNALSSKRNRQILYKIAEHYKKHSSPMTVNELFEQMNLRKGAKKGVWRNLDTLVQCGLVNKIPEGRKLQKYTIYGNKTTIRIRLPLTQERKRERK